VVFTYPPLAVENKIIFGGIFLAIKNNQIFLQFQMIPLKNILTTENRSISCSVQARLRDWHAVHGACYKRAQP
jgi:hypothetical protein